MPPHQLRERREALGLSQAQVAYAAGVSSASVSYLEHDSPEVGARAWARVLRALAELEAQREAA